VDLPIAPIWRIHTLKPFSIIIPVYNEADIIVENTKTLMAYLMRRHKTFEIIIGSNGSVDNTVPLGEALAEQYPLVSFFHLEQRGVGYAFRQAVEMARYDFVVSLDMDLSIDLGFIDSRPWSSLIRVQFKVYSAIHNDATGKRSDLLS